MNMPPDRCSQCAGQANVRSRNASALLLICLLFAVAPLISGCQSPPVFPDSGTLADRVVAQPPDARTTNYATNMLHEGDVVTITFQYSTNFNAAQKIALDGALNLDSVGPVKAAGKTVTELQTELGRLYKPLVKDDVITVKITASENSVYIAGAVIRPGKVVMERPMTALEAVMEAGGFDPSRARLTDVTVLRIEDGKQKTYRLNLKRALHGKDEKPFYLQPFDILNVPTKTFNF